MAVYDPSGSNGVHMPKSISGGKKATAKSTPAKKAAPGKQDKAAPPFPPKKGAPAKKGAPPFPPKKGK